MSFISQWCNDDENTRVREIIHTMNIHRQEKEDNVSQGDIHPLLVELILENVMGWLSAETLKAARLVCTYWNDVAIPILQKRAPEISFNEDNYWTNAKNHKIDAMKQFTNVVENSLNFPFVKFDVGTSVISVLHENTVNNFFKVCSPLAEELTIRDEWGKRIFRSGYPKDMNFHRLRTLCIHLLQTNCNIQHFFGFVQEIMQVAPNVTKLVLVNHNGTDEGDVVTQMISVLKKTPLIHVKNLVMEAQMNEPHLISLSELNFSLSSLSFDFWGSCFTTESMSAFLNSQRKTLEYLKISDSAMSTDCQIKFPRMEILKTLKIKGSMLGRITVTFPNISYIQQFPKLKKLALCELFGEWDEFLSPNIKPTDTVEELKLPSDFGDDLALRRAAYIFPRLKKLEVPSYPHVLEVVYEIMNDLEDLVINTHYVSNIDNLITGIPSTICQRILECDCCDEEHEENNINEFRINKSITNLPKLKSLRLKCKRSRDIVEITDVSYYYALLYMKQLKYLDLDGRPNQFSDQCLAKMTQKFLVLL